MIRAVLWDLDDTLLDFKKGESYAIRRVLQSAGVEPTDAVIRRYSAINDECWKMLERGELARERLYSLRFERLFAELGVQADVETVAYRYPRELGHVAYFIPGSFELCTALKSRYRQYIVTNGQTFTARNRLRLSGFDRLMDGFFISEELGVNKPSPLFFDRCFEKMDGLSREECVIVGDSLTSDILGGRNAGLRCIWYDPHHSPCSDPSLYDARIENLYELPALLETM